MNRAQEASNLLYGHWTSGQTMSQLPESLRPTSEEEGYAIQALLETRSDFPLFGWKIAATSSAGQAHIQVGGPLAGRILGERVRESGGRCHLGLNLMRVAELEFAFRMSQPLAPRGEGYSMDEVLSAVASLHPSIEIPDTRLREFEQVGAPQLIADNACAHEFVLGSPAPDSWRTINLAEHEVWGRVNGASPQRGIGRNVLGDPRSALTWLINRLNSLGVSILPGQVITTGTCLAPIPIQPGDQVTGDFGKIGQVSVSIV